MQIVNTSDLSRSIYSDQFALRIIRMRFLYMKAAPYSRSFDRMTDYDNKPHDCGAEIPLADVRATLVSGRGTRIAERARLPRARQAEAVAFELASPRAGLGHGFTDGLRAFDVDARTRAPQAHGCVPLVVPDLCDLHQRLVRTLAGQGEQWMLHGANVAVLPAGDGSVSAPSVSFANDANSGLFSQGADIVRMAAGGAPIQEWDYSASGVFSTIKGQALSNNGPTLTVERNSSSTGAPGILSLYDKAGTRYYLWITSAGKLMINTAAPSVIGGDTTGTVVGTQS